MEEQEEARRILAMYNGDIPQAFELIRQQCTTMAQRGSLLLTLSGVSMTIFCISGKYFGGKIEAAQIGMVCGELLILLSAFWVFYRVMRIQWVSSFLSDDPMTMLVGGLRERNIRRAGYLQAGGIFLAGAGLYLSCLFYLFLTTSQGAQPVPGMF